MKKWIARITLILCGLGIVGFLVYELYIKPFIKIKGLDHWYEYALVFILLTVMYGLVYLLIKGAIKLIDWAAENAE